MESSKSQRVQWIDALKVLTMLLVIMGHCTYYTINTKFGGIDYPPQNEVSLFYKLLTFVTTVIYTFHMPLFMAVSGACFSWSIGRYPNVKLLIRNKVHRLLVPFVLVTTFVSVPLKYISGYYDNSEFVLCDIFYGQYLLMGNSHLWFIVSLFYIFIIFYYVEKLNIRHKWVYWGVMFTLPLLRIILWNFFEIPGGLLGFSGMLEYLLFFSIGFSSFKYLDSLPPSTMGYQIISWIAFLGVIMLTIQLSKCIESQVLTQILLYPLYFLKAIWGCINMVCIAKSICKCKWLLQTKIYQYFKKYTYELYLYSDPFNYLFIALLSSLFGQYIYMGIFPIYAYSIRFIGTILAAMFIIRYIHGVSK